MNTSATLQAVPARSLRGRLGAAVVALAFAVGAGTTVFAQQPEAGAAGALDAKAIGALSSMGKYLRALKAFALHVDTTTDEVLDNGQKVQFSGTVDYQFQAPNHLRAEVRGERKHRLFFYDGKTITQYAPRVKYYASVAAAATIREALETAEEKYDIEVPLADLFFWGTDQAGTEDIREASAFGPERIGRVDCDHYAFRQEDVDWQVWVERGNRPLPCKMVITTLDDPAQPQYAAVFKWNLSPKIDKATFAFVPPKDAKQIEVAPVAANN